MINAWREALDAGMFASVPGGLIANGGMRQIMRRNDKIFFNFLTVVVIALIMMWGL